MFVSIFLYIRTNSTLKSHINIINSKTFRYLYNSLIKLIPTPYLLLSVDPLGFCLSFQWLLLFPCWKEGKYKSSILVFKSNNIDFCMYLLVCKRFFLIEKLIFNRYLKLLKWTWFNLIYILFLEEDAFLDLKFISRKK